LSVPAAWKLPLGRHEAGRKALSIDAIGTVSGFVAPVGASGGNAGAALQTLRQSRDGVDGIRAALTTLRARRPMPCPAGPLFSPWSPTSHSHSPPMCAPCCAATI